MRKIAVGLGVAVAIASVRCEGTNTGNPPGPLVSFTGSDCQLAQGETPVASSTAALGTQQNSAWPIGTSRQALSPDGGGASGPGLDSNQNDFLWMRCIEWNLDDDQTLQVNFWNTAGGCSATWTGGSASFEDNALHLDAFEKDCQVAGCGLCIYDFHFEVRDAPEGDIPLDLTHSDGHGNTCSDSVYGESFTLPTSKERHGTRCNPLFGVGFKSPVCVRHGACGDMVQAGPGGTRSCPMCPNGDVCAPIAEGKGKQCLKPCTTDADCENSAMACRDGGCAIVSTW